MRQSNTNQNPQDIKTTKDLQTSLDSEKKQEEILEGKVKADKKSQPSPHADTHADTDTNARLDTHSESSSYSTNSHATNPQSDFSQSDFTQSPLAHTLKSKFLTDKARFVTAFVLIGVLVLVLSIDSPLLTCVILGLLCLVGVQESLKLYSLPSALHYYVATALIWVMAYFNDRIIESALFVLVIYASALAYSKAFSPKVLLPFIYPVLPFLSIYALYKDAGGAGVWVIVWLIVIVAMTDTGAYFGGKIFGKTPFCPTSPKKTIEGVASGILCGVVFGSLVGIGACGGFFASLGITIIVAVASVFGDLFESYLKREAGVKDSGSLLPGHGGVLDRLDAVLFGAVVMHFLLFFLSGYRESLLIF